LTSRTALVTGSSQGIGKAIALALAEYGANVIIHGRNELAAAHSVAAQARSYGVQAWVVMGDLGEADAAEALYRQCRELAGDVHILVLNASVQVRSPWTEATEEDFTWQVNVNWRTSLQLMQRFAPVMAAGRWGRLLTIGSVQQAKPHPHMITYAATKAAMVNTVKNLAMQLAKDGITVNNLAPGVILTGRNEEALADEAYRELVKSRIPAGFFGESTDCAGLVVLLCSDAGRYITGQDIFVDGGMGG
jgi:NAD(P)-dependent dehydrogenase (short-subunit alcohol dehydrogenase family)